MHEADEAEVMLRAQRDVVRIYRQFVTDIRSLRLELEAELARLRAVMRAIETERDMSAPLQ